MIIKLKLVIGTAWHMTCSCLYSTVVFIVAWIEHDTHVYIWRPLTSLWRKIDYLPIYSQTCNQFSPLFHIGQSMPSFQKSSRLSITSASWVYKCWITELKGCLRRGPRSVGCKNISIRFHVYGPDEVESERNKKKT